MRPLALTGLCLLVVTDCFGQGQLRFANRQIGDGIDAPIYDVDGVTKLDGPAFKTQLYWGSTPDSLSPVGPILDFRSGAGAGYIVPTVVTLPDTYGGVRGYVDMRAWAATRGDTWEMAAATGSGFGKSNTLLIALTEPPSVPAELFGLRAFALVPEPSCIALVICGLACIIPKLRTGKLVSMANHSRQATAAPTRRRALLVT